MAETTYVIGILSALVVVSEVLVRKTFLKHIGTALLVILLTALLANTGVLPAGSTEADPVPAYDFIFSTVAPLAIFWLLLSVNLKDVLEAGLPMILMFLFGSLATMVGVVFGMWIVNGPETIGPLYGAVAGMFVGTYTGGSINFNAVALHYDVVREGVLYSGSVVVDNIMTTVWMVVTLAVPRTLAHVWPKSKKEGVRELIGQATTGEKEDTETVHPIDIGIVLALGFGSVWLSERISEVWPLIPSILVLTIIALLLAQVRSLSRLAGVRVLGMFAVYLFLAVIGAFCDIAAMSDLGHLGSALLLFTFIAVLVHGVIVYGGSLLFRVDPVIASVASQANVGGGTSALALARSLGREDLVLPAVLIGSLGNAIGSFLGFGVASFIMPLFGSG